MSERSGGAIGQSLLKSVMYYISNRCHPPPSLPVYVTSVINSLAPPHPLCSMRYARNVYAMYYVYWTNRNAKDSHNMKNNSRLTNNIYYKYQCIMVWRDCGIDKLTSSFVFLLLSLTAFSFILHFIFIFFLSFLYSTGDFEWVEKVL